MQCFWYLCISHATGNSEKAAEILEKLEKECPNVLSLILRRINVIRRRHEYEKVCSLYEHYIEQNQDKREFVSSLSIKYARFCCKVSSLLDLYL